jgi:1-acyl-sn-glycerol-3-phosphate acyltransferase
VFRGIIAMLVLILVTVFFGVTSAVVNLVRRESDATMRLGRLWSRAMLAVTGARVTYFGLENLRASQPCVYISNHQSNVDIWALICVLPVSTRFVAKEELFRIPALGWAMAGAGFVSIDRGNRSKAIRSLELAAQKIRAGRSLVLFPEGTRSRSGELGPFKKGPFHLAVQAGVPLVPVAIKGSGRIVPPHSIRVRPGPVEVRVLPPVAIEPFLPNDYLGLRRDVHARIAAALDEKAPTGTESVAAGTGVR